MLNEVVLDKVFVFVCVIFAGEELIVVTSNLMIKIGSSCLTGYVGKSVYVEFWHYAMLSEACGK